MFPQFNASIDLAADEIIVKKYVNIGVAVDTDRGLLVPVIRDADRKNIVQLSVELAQLSEKARTRKISLEEMQGGCFSISNLGGIGGTYFTPIVNAPEVAILGISRARMEPVYDKDERPVRAALHAAAVAVLRSPRRSTAPTASASCAGWPRRWSSRSCCRSRDETEPVTKVGADREDREGRCEDVPNATYLLFELPDLPSAL